MGKVDINTVSTPFHGKVGLVVFRNVRGRLQVAAPPVPSRLPPTEAQLAHHQEFREGISYAKSALADPISRPVYERASERRQQNAFPLAVGDFFNPPVVQRVDLTGFTHQPGGKVVVFATDDVEVKSVTVIVRKSDGTILEQGPAQLVLDKWIYTTTTAVVPGTNLIFEVTAADWPGNEGKANKLYP